MIETYPDASPENEPPLSPSDRFDLFLMTLPGWNEFVSEQPAISERIYSAALNQYAQIEPEIIALCSEAELSKVGTSILFDAFHQQGVSPLDLAVPQGSSRGGDDANRQP